MFEKLKELIYYSRDNYTIEEKLYELYMSMRKVVSDLENIKYSNPDPYQNNQEFKQGFIAGIKIISSILIDM